ncbi:SLATT domain-containing protein [Streptomyces sp. 8ZJF_21]|uniref:SLATT domain-containing protein n=1 Tax=Streptomyces sp. 8ZJF_21 TaxID=2903141 RepID=UPI001E528B3D|nr:SLATT domain-containing protein [Streptomyces sp. 8ZJF_21]MCD9592327.1 SLATT domain-containing protein [Streptomyces sp. 8ZJF_21]
MASSLGVLNDGTVTDEIIGYRREIADLTQRIKNRRFQVLGLYGTPVALVLLALSWAGLKILVWLHGDTPSAVNGICFAGIVVLGLASAMQYYVEFESEHWEDSGKSIRALKLELSLAEERHVLEIRRRTPPPQDRQASYKEKLPSEVSRLRQDSRYYRRMHLVMQWLLFISSAAISAVTAWYDPPQPVKGVLIVLGFTVTVITGAAGYFKPRERAFNLQQTADSIQQHVTALELGIAPYSASEEKLNLELFATTVERLRAEQRMREQQLDQPQQGQQQVI